MTHSGSAAKQLAAKTGANAGAHAQTVQHRNATQRSLFGEILDWMLIPLLLLWPVSIAITYLAAKSIANQPFDRALEDKVTVVAQQVRSIRRDSAGRLPASAKDLLRADDVDTIYYQILGPENELIDGELDLPLPSDEEIPAPWSVQLRSTTMHNAEVRVAYTYIELKSAEQKAPQLALVQVAETLDKRRQLANQIIKGVILPELIILPVALALVWFALTRGLAPLTQLQQRIRARRPDDLSPIDAGQVPEEISPLVASLNEMLARLSQTIKMQKRFIADAAHQMKTPLAGMRMQSELALRQTSALEIHRSLEQLSKSSEAATRLINQLLALARAENQTPLATPLVVLDLTALVRTTVKEWVQASFGLKIDLGFEQPDHAVMIKGNPTMVREMLNNLIDNALRYTPASGSVTVRVKADAPANINRLSKNSRRVSDLHEPSLPTNSIPTDSNSMTAVLEVEDNGPGIAVTERGHVFERFYRILGSNVEGSGLGLAIVREIVQQHDAEVDINFNPRARAADYPGCIVKVVFRRQHQSHFNEDRS
jgi:two-component system sensor histidine kinase TctE